MTLTVGQGHSKTNRLLGFAPRIYLTSLSVLTAIYQVNLVSRCLLKQRMMEVVVTAGAIGRAKLQSKLLPPTNQHQLFFTRRMPFLSPNQQCQSTEGKISHPMEDLLTPNSPGSLSTLSLATNSSWLP